MKIYRSGSEIYDLVIDDKTQLSKKLMGADLVTMNVTVSSRLDLQVNDYILLDGIKYQINRPPHLDKKSAVQYNYDIQFEGPYYLLLDKIVMLNGEAEFYLTGNASDFLNLILSNINSIDSGWTAGTVLATDWKNLYFSGKTCKEALDIIAKEFSCEFSLTDKQINIVDRVENLTALTFQHGKGNGLYELTRESVDDGNTVTRAYVFGSTRNIPYDYRGGANRLIFENLDGTHYLENTTEYSRIVEKTIVFENIYPRFEGAVNTVSADKKTFSCPAIDFDVNAQLLSGITAKVVFLDGDLMGNQFEITSFNNTTKEVTIKAITQSGGLTLPDANTFYPKAGDKFVFVDIKMPQSYIDSAEANLKAAGQSWIDYYSQLRVKYSLKLDPRYIRDNAISLNIGDVVQIVDTELGINKQIRITGITENIDGSGITAEISNFLEERFDKEISSQLNDALANINSISNDVQQQNIIQSVYKGSRIWGGTDAKRINDLVALSAVTDGHYFEVDSASSSESQKVSAVKIKDYLATYLWAKTDLVESAQYLYANGQKIKAGYADNAGLLDSIDSSQFLRRDIDQTVNANTEWLSNLIANAGFEAGINGQVMLEMTAGLIVAHEDISTPDYISKTTGWKADKAGNFDVRTIYTDELIAKAFTADISQALAGSDFLTKSVSKLSSNFTVPATSNTSQLIIDDLEGFPGVRAFQDNDYIRLRVFDRSGGGLTIADVWGTVILNASYGAGGFASDNTQAYIFTSTDDGGASGLLVYKGAEVLDYGQSGDGLIERTVLDAAGAPYSQVVKWTSDPSVPANYQVLTRMGVLDGIANASGAGLYGENTFLTEKLLVGDLTKAGNYLEYVNGVLTINAVVNVIAGGNAETQSGAQAKVDAVQIGSRNLMQFTDVSQNIISNYSIWSGLGVISQVLGSYLSFSFSDIGNGGIITPAISNLPAGAYMASLDVASHYNWVKFDYLYILRDEGNYRLPNISWPTTTEFQRIQIPFTLAVNSTNVKLLLGYQNDGTSRGIWVKGLKIESGNKATDWTPAPEDQTAYTDAKASSAQSAAQTYADNGISVLQTSLGAMAYEQAVGLAKLDSTIIEGGFIKTTLINAGALVIGNSQVTGLGALALVNSLSYTDVGADASGSAASAQATAIATAAADATNKVNAVQIGGTNLFQGTSQTEFMKTTPIDGTQYFGYNAVTFEANREYTLSFYFKCAAGITAFSYNYLWGTDGQGNTYLGYMNVVSDGSWYKYSLTFSFNSIRIGYVRLGLDSRTTSAGDGIDYYIKSMKLEIGNKATDWSPAPEDVNAAISAVDAAKLDAVINGKTVIVNGLVDTSFLNTTWLQAQLITASNIAALSVDFVQGTIGGINIASNALASSNGKWSLGSDGKLIAHNAIIYGSVANPFLYYAAQGGTWNVPFVYSFNIIVDWSSGVGTQFGVLPRGSQYDGIVANLVCLIDINEPTCQISLSISGGKKFMDGNSSINVTPSYGNYYIRLRYSSILDNGNYGGWIIDSKEPIDSLTPYVPPTGDDRRLDYYS